MLVCVPTLRSAHQQQTVLLRPDLPLCVNAIAMSVRLLVLQRTRSSGGWTRAAGLVCTTVLGLVCTAVLGGFTG